MGGVIPHSMPPDGLFHKISPESALGRHTPYLGSEGSQGGVGDPKSLRFTNHYALYHTNILNFSLLLVLNQFIGGAYKAASQQLSAQGLDQ